MNFRTENSKKSLKSFRRKATVKVNSDFRMNVAVASCIQWLLVWYSVLYSSLMAVCFSFSDR
eukprot:m.134440 g.134440  ORF g.134440 m.134440 type:complete len:62 (+) comp38139_c0_seq20:53-238(+)